MTKKQRQAEQILNHGLKLKRIFNLDSIGPVTLCKALHRIETRAHRLAEMDCNEGPGDILEKAEPGILKALDRILNFKAQNLPVFINSDPRGYALKIDDEYVREHNLDIYRDWGGYGIIAPEFDGGN